MSLQAILAKIEAAGHERVQEIEAQASTEANAILEGARLEARKIAEETCAIVAEPAMRERARVLHRARQEALTRIGDIREGLVDETLQQIREYLSNLRQDAAYPQILSHLTAEALTELQASLEETGKDLLEADPKDKDLLKEILPRIRLNPEVQFTLDCWGGVVAKSPDSRVVVINTLESRLEHSSPYLRRSLSALFEKELEPAEISPLGERTHMD